MGVPCRQRARAIFITTDWFWHTGSALAGGHQWPQVVKKAQQRWHALAEERDEWTQGLLEELTSKRTP